MRRQRTLVRPPVPRSTVPTWQNRVKEFYTRLQLSGTAIAERRRLQGVRSGQPEDEQPDQDQEVSGGPLAYVFICKKCDLMVRSDSPLRLRQHLIGRLLASEGPCHVRLCVERTSADRDVIRGLLRALIRAPAAGEDTTGLDVLQRERGGDFVVDSTPPRYGRLSLASSAGNPLAPAVSSAARNAPAAVGPSTNAELRQAIANFIIFTCSSFRVVDSPHFHTLIDVARRLPENVFPRIPTRDTVSTSLLDAALEESTSELRRLQGHSQEIFGSTLCHDSWSNACNRGFSNVACITKGIEVFQDCYHDCRKTAPVIAAQLSKAIEDVGRHNVTLLACDGAATCAFVILRPVYPHIFMIRCAVHLEDLKLEDLGKIPVFFGILSRTRTSSQFLINHANLLVELARHSEQRPVKFCKTRFAIQVLTADRLLLIREGCVAVVNSAEWKRWLPTQKKPARRIARKFRDRMLRGTFWDSVELALKVFVPVLKLLRSADSHKAGFAGKYMVRQAEVQAEIDQVLECHPDPAVRVRALDALRKRRKDGHDMLFSVAFLLDPCWVGRSRLELLGAEWSEQVRVDWLEFLGTLPDADRQPVINAKLDFDFSRDSFAHPVVVETRTTMPAHLWWHSWGDAVPVLQRLACRILSCPIGAAACERNWSLYSFAMSSRRPVTTKKLVGAMSNRIALANIRDPRMQEDRDPWEPPEVDVPDRIPADDAALAEVIDDDDSVGIGGNDDEGSDGVDTDSEVEDEADARVDESL
eukprot:GHVU01190368.1.p1 GENE.GHVU01190368.1~~GHVU01190368.1.p1  ORF type:complete len:756 (-),score=87.69 GHVU01190368.1:980-3247(-)